MYGLVQAGIIAHTHPKKHLHLFGYETSPITPGIWQHNKNSITCTLLAEDFGIKYLIKEDSQHLVNSFQEKYEVTQDWTGSIYSGVTLNWYYKARILEISMPILCYLIFFLE